MKNSKIQKTFEGLKPLKTKKLPIKMALVMARNMRVLEEAVSDIDERRVELVKEYAEKDEKGEVRIDENGNAKVTRIDEFSKEMSELFDTDLDLKFEMISEKEIEKCEEDKYDSLTMEEVDALSFMIEG